MANEPTTTQTGTPVGSDAHSLTAGRDGVTALHDRYLVEKLAQFNRERIPERIVHAKGGGAFGTFEVTGDVTAYTKAAVFQPGAVTRTVQNLDVVRVDAERGLLLVKGAVPGHKNSDVIVRPAVKAPAKKGA